METNSIQDINNFIQFNQQSGNPISGIFTQFYSEINPQVEQPIQQTNNDNNINEVEDEEDEEELLDTSNTKKFVDYDSWKKNDMSFDKTPLSKKDEEKPKWNTPKKEVKVETPKIQSDFTTNLAKNFNLGLFTKSTTASKKGIKNDPGQSEIRNLQLLNSKILEPLREQFGKFTISSAYRSNELNQAIGGAKGSQHTKGEAIDLQFADNAAAFDFIRNSGLDYDQLIWEEGNDIQPKWIHISYNPYGKGRKQVLKMKGGKYTTM